MFKDGDGDHDEDDDFSDADGRAMTIGGGRCFRLVRGRGMHRLRLTPSLEA